MGIPWLIPPQNCALGHDFSNEVPKKIISRKKSVETLSDYIPELFNILNISKKSDSCQLDIKSKLSWKLPAFADQIWSSLLAELLKAGFRSESGKEEEKSKSGDSTWCRWPHTSEFHRQCKRKKDFLRQKYKIQNLVEWAWENGKIDKIKRQKCPPQIGWMGGIVKASRCRKEANSIPREGNGRSGPTGSSSLLLYNFCKSSLI